MKTVYLLIFACVFMLAACAPSSKHEQLDKILGMANDLFDEGYSSDALPYAEQAMEFSVREFGEVSSETAKVSKRLAYIFYEKRMFGSARKEYSRLIRILNSLPGEDKADLIEAYMKLSQIALAFEDIEGARDITEHVLDLQNKFVGPNAEETIDSAFKLARINGYLGDNSEMYKYINMTVSKLESVHGEDTIESVKYLNMKLQFQEKEENVDGRIVTLRKLIKVMKKNTGEESKATAEHMNMLVDALVAKEEFNEANSVCEKALVINRKILSQNDPALINTCRKLAEIKFHLEQFPKMESLLLEAIKYSGGDSLNDDLYEKALESLCMYYMEFEDFKKAEQNLLKLFELRKKNLSGIHPDLVFDMNRLADCYIGQQEYVKAQAMLEQGYDVVAHSYGKQTKQALAQVEKMAALSYKAKKYPQAITRCEDVINELKESYPDNHPLFFPFYKRLSIIFKTTRDLEKAADFSIKALKVSEFVHGTESANIVADLSEIVDLYKLMNKPTKAITFAERSVKILEQDQKLHKLDLAAKLNDLAALYEVTGDKAKAELLYKKSRDVYSTP